MSEFLLSEQKHVQRAQRIIVLISSEMARGHRGQRDPSDPHRGLVHSTDPPLSDSDQRLHHTDMCTGSVRAF
ncbi:hypothetical protein NQZ68_027444 [Dissostichus eleginoides]|nr:hypothetical protein NQZ68_027444 [Dissostichus eleginoides]